MTLVVPCLFVCVFSVILTGLPYTSFCVYHFPKRHMMGFSLNSFIGFFSHHSCSVTFCTLDFHPFYSGISGVHKHTELSWPRLGILGVYKLHRSLVLQTQKVVMIQSLDWLFDGKDPSSSTTIKVSRHQLILSMSVCLWSSTGVYGKIPARFLVTMLHRCHGSTRRRDFRLFQQFTLSYGVTLLFLYLVFYIFSHRESCNTDHLLFQSSDLDTRAPCW